MLKSVRAGQLWIFCACLSTSQISELVNGGIALNDLSQSQLDVLQKDYPALIYFRGSQLSEMKVTVATSMSTILTVYNGLGNMLSQGGGFNRLRLYVVPR